MSIFSAPGPSLPTDADAEPRQALLRKVRESHSWDWSWPPGCATLRRLPSGDRYALGFIAESIALQGRTRQNRAALSLDGTLLPADPPPPAKGDWVVAFDNLGDIAADAPTSHPRSIDAYADYFVELPRPPLVDRLRARPEDADALFAWQRVAGANPMTLRCATRLPDDFAVSDALWQRVVGRSSLAATMDEGRLFEADYTLLHGAITNRYLGRQKYLCGARGLFTTASGPLLPVAIQLEPGGRVFAPGDGAAWSMAKYCLQVADANVHETMEHLGATHMVMEAVGIAARRQLAAAHPVMVLLEHHLVGTFAINESAKTNLIAPEGVIDRVFSARIDVAASLVRVALDRFSLQDRAPSLELRARGVDDPSRLPEYPYRDDALRVYGAIERFVEGFVRAYYPDDAAVRGDPELRAFVGELGSPIGGALRGVRPVETVDALVTLLSNVVHVASAQHAAVNFPQYDCFGWGANAAGACWAPPPGEGATEAELLAMMPTWDCLMLQTDTVFQLAGIYYKRLGDYALRDPRLDDLVARFNADLADVERRIEADDAGRRMSYRYLLPSKIPPSINI
ncbi:MAG: lipoxygenase family protein [Polyangiales bacterium]